jgi:RND family efflux transporter MFP subunit
MIERRGDGSMQDVTASGALLEQVHILFTEGTATGLADGELLDRFLHDGRESGEAAFNVLVERHGPLVLSVCNQALRDRHAAEDAFQATFLVLARQARSIRNRDSVGSWLFGVASRAAARIRMMEARRRKYERRGASVRAHGEPGGGGASDAWPELHAEIARLPEKYRIPIVLCYFEGLTHEQAAGRLGWPVGTVKIRLARARDQLRWRLDRIGYGTAPLIPLEVFRPLGVTRVPRVLLESTTRAAARFVWGVGAGEIFISSDVLTLARGVLKTMAINPLRVAAITLFGVTALGLGAMVFAKQAVGERQTSSQPRPGSTSAPDSPQGALDGQSGMASAPTKDAPRPKILSLLGSTAYSQDSLCQIHSRFDCLVEKIFVGVGELVKKGDPLLELSSTELAVVKNAYQEADSEWRRAKEDAAKVNPGPHRELVMSKGIHSRNQMKAARDRLLQYGLTEEEIERARSESGAQKTRMTIRSPVDGLVTRRTVSLGQFYEPKYTLAEITQDDPLGINVGIDPRDAEYLEVGQRMTINFPFSERVEVAKVRSIRRELDPRTGKVIVRTSIPNSDHRLKPGTAVDIRLELAPVPKPTIAGSAPEERQTYTSLDERLNELERKMRRLLDEKDGRSTNDKILERLSELERKLDRVLSLPTAK